MKSERFYNVDQRRELISGTRASEHGPRCTAGRAFLFNCLQPDSSFLSLLHSDDMITCGLELFARDFNVILEALRFRESQTLRHVTLSHFGCSRTRSLANRRGFAFTGQNPTTERLGVTPQALRATGYSMKIALVDAPLHQAGSARAIRLDALSGQLSTTSRSPTETSHET